MDFPLALWSKAIFFGLLGGYFGLRSLPALTALVLGAGALAGNYASEKKHRRVPSAVIQSVLRAPLLWTLAAALVGAMLVNSGVLRFFEPGYEPLRLALAGGALAGAAPGLWRLRARIRRYRRLITEPGYAEKIRRTRLLDSL